MSERIAFVINSIHLGGPSSVIRNIFYSINREKFELYLITIFDESTPEVIEEVKKLGVKVVECKFRGRANAVLFGQKKFNEIIKRYDIKIIHSHGYIPDILSSRVKEKFIKKITTIQNNPFYDYAEVYGKAKSVFFLMTHFHYLKKIDTCACCSSYVYDAVKNKLSNTIIIRNGIGNTVPKKPVSRTDIGVPKNAILFIYVGQLRARKNIIWLIQQFKKYHRDDEYLIVLGKGADKEACEKIQDPNIIHYGFSDNPYGFMSISNVYISAALAEGFSISVLEAMDNGLALFLSDIPAHTEAFKAAEGVFIGESFKSNDSASFEKKLNVLREELHLIDRDAIRQIKDKEMSAEKMTKQYETIYSS